MYNALKESDWESTSSSESESMEAILRSFGYNEDQIRDALQHCDTVEEAIVYIPTIPKYINESCQNEQVPDVYCIEEDDGSIVDLASDDSSSSSDDENRFHFNGDSIFLNRISEIHRVNNKRFVSLDRLFCTTDTLEHDKTISHIFMSSFVYSDSILDSIATQHKDAEITFATHLDPHEQDREPFVMNDGKCILVFPPFPNRNAYGCFHIKTLLIRFKDRLRVVISSSNLFTPDWTKWSQGVWMQDFYFCKEGMKDVASKKMDYEFREQLIALMRACKCPDSRIFNLLKNVYFENVHVRLVLSIPQLFNKRNMNRYGHMRLRTIIHDLYEFYSITNHPVKEFTPILSLCSSIGSPSQNWLQSILSSCNGGKEYPPKTGLDKVFHMVFPTLSYVKNSRLGVDNAGSLILKRKTYLSKTFPKKCLKRYKDIEGRENTLPHVKYLMNVPLRNNPRLPWVYVGSHNFTRSAWGFLMKEESFLSIMNYECGVVLLPKNFVDYFNGDLKKEDYRSEMEHDDFCEPVDLAFDAPCMPYREEDIPFTSEFIVCL